MNYWWEVDGIRDDLTDPRTSSSEIVQEFLPDARVVKAFNHMGYHDLEDEARPAGATGPQGDRDRRRRPADADAVARPRRRPRLRPVVVGSLADGVRLEPARSPSAPTSPPTKLRAMIERDQAESGAKEVS